MSRTDYDEQDDVRHLMITKASTIKPRRVRWAWKWEGAGRIPAGTLALAAGREGTGKSSFALWLAAQVTTGTLPGEYEGTPRAVLYVATEDSWEYTLIPRLMAAGADLDMVYRVSAHVAFEEEVTLSLPQDNAHLEQVVEDTGAALVVLDPLMSLLGDGLSASKGREVRRMLDPLMAVARRTDCIMLGIAHHNKGAHGDPIMAVSESKVFTDAPRSVFAFARDDERECRVMSQTKNSLGLDPSQLPSMDYTMEGVALTLEDGQTTVGRFKPLGASSTSVAELLRDTSDARADLNEAQTFVVDYLTDHGGEALAADVFKAGRAEGFSQQQLKDARRRIKGYKVEAARRKGFQGGTLWTLSIEPDGGTDLGSMVANVAPVAHVATSATNATNEHSASAPAHDASSEDTLPLFDLPTACPHGAPPGEPCLDCQQAQQGDERA